VDAFVAISAEVQARIRRFYNRDSVIIHPPVDTRRFETAHNPGDYFLIVSRLIPYKRIDLAIRAFTDLGLPLWIGGDGRDRSSLEAMAGSNVRFLGRVPDEELGQLLAQCRAFIFPGLEDFGITPVEAMAAGRPVIAYAGGGALDYVLEGVTGTFFHEQSPESLANAVRGFDDAAYDPETIRAHAKRFDTSVFEARMNEFIQEQLRN
jgi:glycosyltransferase involved in cell wall biosynthesis